MALPVLSSSKPPHLIAVAAGKGGVGKSTVTVNLALALKEKGFNVGILDADLYGPSLRRMLPEEQPPTQKGPSLTPAICLGIKVISMAYFHPENHSVAIRAPIANNLVNQFLSQVDWGPLDFLFIDFPPGTGDIQLTISQKVPLSGAIMVTTPQQVSIMDVRKAIHLFTQVLVPIVGLVENMSYLIDSSGKKLFPFGQGGGVELAEEERISLLAKIPIDPFISLCADRGISLLKKDSPSCQVFRNLANILQDKLKRCKADRFLVKVSRIDAHHIELTWSSGSTSKYRLSELQKNCPCADCETKEVSVSTDVECVKVSTVGRYALKVQFTSGCSKGIYTFDILCNL